MGRAWRERSHESRRLPNPATAEASAFAFIEELLSNQAIAGSIFIQDRFNRRVERRNIGIEAQLFRKKGKLSISTEKRLGDLLGCRPRALATLIAEPVTGTAAELTESWWDVERANAPAAETLAKGHRTAKPPTPAGRADDRHILPPSNFAASEEEGKLRHRSSIFWLNHDAKRRTDRITNQEGRLRPEPHRLRQHPRSQFQALFDGRHGRQANRSIAAAKTAYRLVSGFCRNTACSRRQVDPDSSCKPCRGLPRPRPAPEQQSCQLSTVVEGKPLSQLRSDSLHHGIVYVGFCVACLRIAGFPQRFGRASPSSATCCNRSLRWPLVVCLSTRMDEPRRAASSERGDDVWGRTVLSTRHGEGRNLLERFTESAVGFRDRRSQASYPVILSRLNDILQLLEPTA